MVSRQNQIPNRSGILQFGPFRLDCDNLQLIESGKPIALTPKAMDVLCELASQPGKLVLKQDLLAKIWDDSLVSDASLVVCIREIRQALHDSARQPRFIETVHRRGYRFMAEVTFGVPPQTGEMVSIQPNPSVTPFIQQSIRPKPVSIFGRERELEWVIEHLNDVQRGQRKVIFITGEAGVGKSLLVEHIASLCLPRGFQVGIGRCFERFGTGEPFLPVLDAINDMARADAGERLQQCLRTVAPTWLLQMPWLNQSGISELQPEELLGATPQRMLREFSEFIEVYTIDNPVLLVLEDVHWSDHSTVDLLAHFAQRDQPAQLAILATVRTADTSTRNHPIFNLATSLRLHSRCEDLGLSPLDEAAVLKMIHHRWGEQEVAPNLAHEIFRRSGGHPFFAQQLIAAMGSNDTNAAVMGGTERKQADLLAAGRGNAIPLQIRESIEGLLAQTSPLSQRLLEFASVAGQEFTAAAVGDALSIDLDEVERICDELRNEPPLLEFAGTQHLSDGRLSTRYRFRHVLYQEMLYDRLPPGRRARMHRQLGLLLESLDVNQANERSAELAWHFRMGLDFPRAIQYLQRAAQRAATRFACRESIQYLDTALKIIEDIAEPCPHTQMDLFESRGLARRTGDDMVGAAEDFQRVAALAQANENFPRQVQALFYRSSALSWLDREQCLAASDQAVEASLRVGDHSLIIQARGFAGYWHVLWQGWRDADVDAAQAAVQESRATDNRKVLTKNLAHLSWFASLRADYDQAVNAADEAGRLAVEFGDYSDYMLSVYFQAWGLLHENRLSEATQLLLAGLDISERNEHRRWSLLFRLLLAWGDILREDYEAARRELEQTSCEATSLALPLAQMASPILQAQAELALGELDSATERLARLEEWLRDRRVIMDWTWRIMLQLGQANCCLAGGEVGRAIQFAKEAIGLAETCGELTRMAEGWCILARAAQQQGDDALARTAVAQARIAVSKKRVPLA